MMKVCLLESDKHINSLAFDDYDQVYLAKGKHPKAQTLPSDLMDVTKAFVAQSRAANEIDWVFESIFNADEKNFFVDTFKDERALIFLRKEIVLKLADIFVSFKLAEEFKRQLDIKSNVDFIPDVFEYSLFVLLKNRNTLSGQITVPDWCISKMKRMETKNNLVCSLGISLYPRLIRFAMRGKGRFPSKKKYKYGILMWNSGINIKRNINKLEFLHSRKFDSENFLYVMDRKMQPDVLGRIAENEFDDCYFQQLIKDFDSKIYIQKIYPRIQKICSAFKRLKVQNYFVRYIFLKTLKYFIEWSLFFEMFEVKKMIAMQDPSLSARTLIAEQNGTEVVYVYKSTSFDYVPRQDMSVPADLYYSYMIYGTMYGNKISNESFERSHNSIARYVNVGTLVGDDIVKVKNSEEDKQKIRDRLSLPKGKGVIGFFDTAIGRNGYLNMEEGIGCYQQIYQLLKDHEEYVIVLRTRNVRLLEESDDFSKAFQDFKSHSRVIYVNEVAPEYVGADYMGVCDLVIGGFGSSVPMEAWAGGVKAICQLGSERFRHPSYKVLQMPNYCVLDYKELKAAVDYWFAQDEQSVIEYQHQYVKKYIDQFCDGNAKNRLHEYLYNL